MSSPFRVGYPGTVQSALKADLKKAVRKGRGEEAITAVAEIDRWLREDPKSFGDPLYELQSMTMMRRIYPPWVVVYGVHHEQPVVFVRSILPYPEFD